VQDRPMVAMQHCYEVAITDSCCIWSSDKSGGEDPRCSPGEIFGFQIQIMCIY